MRLAGWTLSMSFWAFWRASSTSCSHSGRLSTGVFTFSVSPFSVLNPQCGQKFESSANSVSHDLHSDMFRYYASDIKNVLVPREGNDGLYERLALKRLLFGECLN